MGNILPGVPTPTQPCPPCPEPVKCDSCCVTPPPDPSSVDALSIRCRTYLNDDAACRENTPCVWRPEIPRCMSPYDPYVMIRRTYYDNDLNTIGVECVMQFTAADDVKILIDGKPYSTRINYTMPKYVTLTTTEKIFLESGLTVKISVRITTALGKQFTTPFELLLINPNTGPDMRRYRY